MLFGGVSTYMQRVLRDWLEKMKIYSTADVLNTLQSRT